LGFLPGIEYLATEKWAFSAGGAFDAIGKFGAQRITQAFSPHYS